MDDLTFLRALRVGSAPRIAFVGAGGKTTSIFRLARQLPAPVLVSTSTHLAEYEKNYADKHICLLPGQPPPQLSDIEGVTLVTGPSTDSGKLTSPDIDNLNALMHLAQVGQFPFLLEADGARKLSLKAYAPHEPVLLPGLDHVLVVAGLSVLGTSLDERTVFRPEIFARLADLPIGGTILPEHILRLLTHPEGMLNIGSAIKHQMVLLNQADTTSLQAVAGGMAETLLADYSGVIVAEMQSDKVYTKYERTAAIVLAAGGASRMHGKAKMVLPWRGKPLVRHVVDAAWQGGIRKIIVVTGAFAAEVAEALEGAPIEFVHNPHWSDGQSSSIKAGLQSLPLGIGAALFMLADQPGTPASLIRKLLEYHAHSLAPIIAPEIDGQRGNPVLFDQVTFDKFDSLTGDAGGRVLMKDFPVSRIPWFDPLAAFDVDTPEAYQNLLDA